MCMTKNGKYTKHTRHIFRIMHFVRNNEQWNIHNIWCEEGLKLEDIGTKNFREDEFNPRVVYPMVMLDD